MEYARRTGKGYVYVLTHIFTGKKYVGKTIEPEERVLTHISQLTRGIHKNKAMQADFDKYHGDYRFAIVEEAMGPKVYDAEKKWMRKLRTYDERYGYNFNDPGMIKTRLANGMAVEIGNRWKRGTRPPKPPIKYIPASEWLQKLAKGYDA